MRTFVAVEVCNENVLNSIAKIQSDLDIRATPVNMHNMHFTLLFLGEITEDAVNNVKKSLSSIIFKPIQVSFTHLGAFPNPKFPRVIWVGIDDVAAKQLVELACQVEQKLGPLGFRSDKPFKPHLTIFRVKNREEGISDKIAKHSKTSLGTDTITEFKFKQSVLTSNGPIYSDLLVVKAQ